MWGDGWHKASTRINYFHALGLWVTNFSFMGFIATGHGPPTGSDASGWAKYGTSADSAASLARPGRFFVPQSKSTLDSIDWLLLTRSKSFEMLPRKCRVIMFDPFDPEKVSMLLLTESNSSNAAIACWLPLSHTLSQEQEILNFTAVHGIPPGMEMDPQRCWSLLKLGHWPTVNWDVIMSNC